MKSLFASPWFWASGIVLALVGLLVLFMLIFNAERPKKEQAMCESPSAWVKDARALGLRSECKSRRIQFNTSNTLVECRMPDNTVVCAVDKPL